MIAWMMIDIAWDDNDGSIKDQNYYYGNDVDDYKGDCNDCDDYKGDLIMILYEDYDHETLIVNAADVFLLSLGLI